MSIIYHRFCPTCGKETVWDEHACGEYHCTDCERDEDEVVLNCMFPPESASKLERLQICIDHKVKEKDYCNVANKRKCPARDCHVCVGYWISTGERMEK